jgi:hypothetical protein
VLSVQHAALEATDGFNLSVTDHHLSASMSVMAMAGADTARQPSIVLQDSRHDVVGPVVLL